MTEKVLPYDRAIVPQETGYWCGPAATQVVLNSRGIRVAEADLAREIGTTVNGTDYVGLIERVLDRRVPDAQFTSVYLQNDPPTAAQRETLWAHITRSVDGGWGVVMNWVAPPSNYPRGVRGSVSPRYSGGTVFHYVGAMGYFDDGNPANRAVWIADSGFQPQGYWISLDQCASLIPPKGYCYANVSAPAPAPQPQPEPEQPGVDLVDILARAMAPTSVPRERLAEYLPHFSEAMRAAQINTVLRAAAWCSQVGHEAAGLLYMAEIETSNPDWSWDRTRYRGRGPIQLTWQSNYRKFGRWCEAQGYVTDAELFVNQPELVEQPKWGFLAASWYWLNGGPRPGQINGFADAGDLLAVSRCVNGWVEGKEPNGWPDRQERYASALALGDQLLALTTTGDDALSGVNIERLNQAVDKILSTWGSRSIYRLTDNSVDDTVGMALNIDGSLHELVTEYRALTVNDADAVALIRATAEGKSAGSRINGRLNPDAVNRAKRILAKVEALQPVQVGNFSVNVAPGANISEAVAKIEAAPAPLAPEVQVAAVAPRPKAVVFTIPGTWAGWNDGPPAWVAWGLDPARFVQQGVDYPATGFLTGDPTVSYVQSRKAGVEETVRLIKLLPDGTPIILIGYSQGADVLVRVLYEFLPGGRLAGKLLDLRQCVTFGSPGRPSGPTNVGNNPPGNGIAGVFTPDEFRPIVLDYINNGDMYACSTKLLKQFYAVLTEMALSVDFATALVQILATAAAGPLVNVPAGAQTGIVGGILTGLLGNPGGGLTQVLKAIAPVAADPKNVDIVKGLLANIPDVIETIRIAVQFQATQAHVNYHVWPDFGGKTAVQDATDRLNALQF